MATTSPSGVTPVPQRATRRRSLIQPEVAAVVAFLASHIVLAIFMKTVPGIATAHAVGALGAGLVFAATTRKLRNIAAVAAYFTGCEVLWRMCKASVFWEFGKYAVVAVLLIGLFRTRVTKNRGLAIAYFALLLPSTALTLSVLDLDTARQEISFYLAGPLELTLAVLFFSNIRLPERSISVIFFALIGPVVGVGALSFLSTTAQDQLDFVNAANSFTSGGFGPNQVAAMLGLASMFLLLFVIERRSAITVKVSLFLLAAALATQSALTFSRGGIVLALAGLCGAMLFLLRGNRRARIAIVVVAAISVLLVQYVIQPKLEAITNGEISVRYSNTKSSGRDLFIASELQLFEEHPVLGVGPGIGIHMREERGLFYGASHTEYSRMLAEHGLFGLFAFFALVGLVTRAYRHAQSKEARAHVTAMVIWAALFLLVYDTRLGAPAFVFGLAFTRKPHAGSA